MLILIVLFRLCFWFRWYSLLLPVTSCLYFSFCIYCSEVACTWYCPETFHFIFLS